MRIVIYLALFGLLFSVQVGAAIDIRHFASIEQERQYRELTEQLRCPKCQNTSIADSNSIIAADMRAKVYQLMEQGQGKQQIIDYMVARYGYFVTYVPPLNPLTIFLWLGPLLLVVIGGALIILRTVRRSRGAMSSRLSQDERRRVAALLANHHGKQP
ncbi:cytochrome c-type biogenesis protein [Acerihabitans sp. TG2]|uniref:cytochrome c-type biogenesis protein n=1 Tax=Acerihabitans sp. TG2 TaxID=3096008 RepID=UPI002B23EA5F|nr:cytochrome c-type biogenesis protein [Acerihabitans sp. TG2]MEA9389103.1 cytochrome c-type biogenesis protein [Acerihabitans sp. TG2]